MTPWRTPLLCAIGAALALLSGGLDARAAETLLIPVGGQRLVDLPAPITRIVIGESGIVDASVVNDRRVQVVGVKAGQTTMAIFTAESGQGTSYLITVDQPGAKVAPVPAPASVLAGALPAEPPVGAGLARALRTEPDLAGVQLHTDGQRLVMSGTVASVEAHAKTMALARAFGGDAVADLTHVGGDQMVAVEIRFAAVAANTMNELGFNFQNLNNGFQVASTNPNSVSSFSVGGASNSSLNLQGMAGLALTAGLPIASAFNVFLSKSNSNVLAIISALNGAGLTQLLAQPTLVVRSGESASFLAGGEVPIPVPQGTGSGTSVTIQYHPYGVRLEVTPIVLSDRRISMRVSPEVSEIDTGNGLQLNGFNVPAFLKRTTSTTVELGDGESFVIAGLMYSNDAISEDRLPFLGKIPILGAFFKLSSNTRTRQEMIVIATPHLVRPLDGRTLPPLPGVEAVAGYNPGVGEMLLNTRSLDGALASYGLMR